MCAAGAVIEQDPAGNRKLTKKKSLSRIDGLVALAMALGCMSTEGEIVMTSPWDDPDYRLAG
jgi:phage terminase large subunit-like protein